MISTLSRWLRSSRPGTSRAARRQNTSRKLHLEILEDRTVPTAIPAPAGILSWWTGDGDAMDLIGPNYGTLSNGANFAAGKVGSGFNFDGLDDLFQAPTVGLPTGSADRTIELWARIDTQVAEETLFAYYGTPGARHRLTGWGPTTATCSSPPGVLRSLVRRCKRIAGIMSPPRMPARRSSSTSTGSR